ncbi:MAG TPA: ferritin-like domain-containing protein [Chitinophagaceae bacterium]|nr:ferritin-like domain-containing protein [Chitinophagaceae bacterium]
MDPQTTTQENGLANVLGQKLHRRKFLLFSGAAASVALVAATGCKKDDNPGTGNNTDGVDLGSGDTGILNYAYALEQLEAAFYTQVIATPFTDMTASEKALLTDIRDHEIVHREFFKNALKSAAIPGLTVNFSAINFTDRTSVLSTAKAFEDLGVAAYNGAGKLITEPAYLVLAGKIVSVEARHAAWIRDLMENGSFADLASLSALGANAGSGLDAALDPKDVLPIAQTFLTTKITAGNLPTA